MAAASAAGVYRNTLLQSVYFGPGSIASSLPAAIEALNLKNKKAFILTGKSLATKTKVIERIQSILSDKGYYSGETYFDIGEHAPVAGIREAVERIKRSNADVIVAVGGGSPIDAAKAISYYRHSEEHGEASAKNPLTHPDLFLPTIAVPTTLSVAETTQNAGFKSDEGHKIGVSTKNIVPRTIIYDAELTLDTPERLWLSTGIRALDHAVEYLYRPDTHPLVRPSAQSAVREIFTYLPLSKKDPKDVQVRQALQLACFNSLWPEARMGALGLSHGLGHKLGATYGIGHGITSCITLGATVRFVANWKDTPLLHLQNLADTLPFIPAPYNSSPAPLGTPVGANGDATDEQLKELREKATLVGDAVQKLVDDLGLHSTLKSCGLGPEEPEIVATKVTGEDKKGGEYWQGVKGILDSVYQ
ncbi:Alcohol dehydrogenase, iron-type [Kalmanozyma brasiliensis GHG001]|uniref:Maleylacetate reductase n=1 Tax=Kalmanozyma brasiliensis (strain GHG001) TaxID=1365824 RepID=V5EIK5_KALBG|nr:Alcohol dehydrogenase, iron-type [Kalmanozyma brasiliensis GHG001]EST04510.1 Alcohol dehydrogenase, iron-type [Kalmanozyma brasiliensis GHG001]